MRTINNRYFKLKRCKLTWEHILTEVEVIDNEELRQDTYQHKDKHKGSVVLHRTLRRM